jgi:membrane protein implicated in regulation of membrane protease activity
MSYPVLLAQASGVVLTTDVAVSWPVLVAFLVLAVAYGEARVHIASLRDRATEQKGKTEALEGRVAVVESRTDRTDGRVDHVLELLTEVRSDVKRLLERGKAA